VHGDGNDARIGRFSRNAIVRGLCYGYVELFRNIPVLLQLIMWYLLFTRHCRRRASRCPSSACFS